MAKKKAEDYWSSTYSAFSHTFDAVYNSNDYQKRRKNMERYLKEYKGEWWNKESLRDNDSKVFVNLFFADVETNAPLLTDNKPKWSIRSRDPMYQGYVDLFQLAGDYLWDKMDMDIKVQDAARNCLIFPAGIMKVIWDTGEDDVNTEVIDPRTFVVAPGYNDPWKAPWCGEQRVVDMLWIKGNFPEAFDQVKPDGEAHAVDFSGFSDVELSGKQVTVREMWIKDDAVEEVIVEDKKEWPDGHVVPKKTAMIKKYPKGRICIFCPNCKVVLDDKASPFHHGKAPYIPFYDYRPIHEFWGQGEIEQVEELVRQNNRTMQTMVNHADRTADPNYTIDSGSGLDPEQVKAEFDNGHNFWTTNANNGTAIMPVQTANLNRVHYDLLNLIPMFFQRVTGVTDISQGIAAKKQRQSANEISVLIESAYTRTRQRVRNLEWSLRRVFELVVELMMQFYSDPRMISFREGSNLSWATVGNSPATAQSAMMPMRLPSESDQDYQKRLEEDKQYQDLLKAITRMEPGDRVYAAFDIEIDTNSTLPMDQQSKANMMMKLASIQITPQSPIDRESLLKTLMIPEASEILARFDQAQQNQARMAAAMAGRQAGGPPNAAPTGPTTPAG